MKFESAGVWTDHNRSLGQTCIARFVAHTTHIYIGCGLFWWFKSFAEMCSRA